MARTVAITGGIGAGKSIVCHIVTALGFPVYDCDSRARALMDADADLRRAIAEKVTPRALKEDGTLDRPALADCVFADSAKLAALNALVHGAVREDFIAWRDSRKTDPIFVETAILYESGFDGLVSEIWEVTAPEDVRIARVGRRSGLSPEQVRSRMAAQTSAPRPGHRIIDNSGARPLLPQLLDLL